MTFNQRYSEAWKRMQEALVIYCKAEMNENARAYQKFREATEEFEQIKKEHIC